MSGTKMVAFGAAAMVALAGQALGQQTGESAQQATPGTGQAQGEAERILAELDALERPVYDAERRDDADYRREYMQAQREWAQQRAELIGELHRAAPRHERTAQLLPERWQLLLFNLGEHETVREEAGAVVGKAKDDKLRAEAAYWHGNALLRNRESSNESILEAYETFYKIAPEDERGARLLTGAADRESDPDKKIAIFRKAAERYAGTRTGTFANGKVKQIEGVGKPFELSFQDAVTGETVSMKDLRGKVVVVDFWATWCGPCIAELPHMKELYEEYASKGVEFIGVSLDAPEDQGGLEKLREFVKERELPWPQYYQGAGWDSDFSMSWGINAIPAIFVVDQQGNLHSTSARGKLDEMIPELLAAGGAG